MDQPNNKALEILSGRMNHASRTEFDAAMRHNDRVYDKPGGFNGKYNMYVCDTCRKYIVTLDKAPGVAPFMIQCKAEERVEGKALEEKTCKGIMASMMYSMHQVLLKKANLKPDATWRRPSYEEFLKMPLQWQQEILRGQLVLTTGGE